MTMMTMAHVVGVIAGPVEPIAKSGGWPDQFGTGFHGVLVGDSLDFYTLGCRGSGVVGGVVSIRSGRGVDD